LFIDEPFLLVIFRRPTGHAASGASKALSGLSAQIAGFVS